MQNFIIFGTPGAGKGTQAEIIAKNKGIHHLSSGEISRQMIKDKVLGAKIKKHLDAGELIPNYIIIDLVEKYLEERMDCGGFIFDGYPRNIGQAKALDHFVHKHKIKIDMVINLKLNEDEALKRILLRGQTSGRSDDNIKTIQNRLRIYKKMTEPILDYYREQGRLKEINGKQPIEKIANQIAKLIK